MAGGCVAQRKALGGNNAAGGGRRAEGGMAATNNSQRAPQKEAQHLLTMKLRQIVVSLWPSGTRTAQNEITCECVHTKCATFTSLNAQLAGWIPGNEATKPHPRGGCGLRLL